jgi:hypothetical protein
MRPLRRNLPPSRTTRCTANPSPAPEPAKLPPVAPGHFPHPARLFPRATRLIRRQVDGVDPGFDLNAPLDASGNALGPFAVGQVVQVMTEVSNSSGTRNSAVRTITIEEPIGGLIAACLIGDETLSDRRPMKEENRWLDERE